MNDNLESQYVCKCLEIIILRGKPHKSRSATLRSGFRTVQCMLVYAGLALTESFTRSWSLCTSSSLRRLGVVFFNSKFFWWWITTRIKTGTRSKVAWFSLWFRSDFPLQILDFLCSEMRSKNDISLSSFYKGHNAISQHVAFRQFSGFPRGLDLLEDGDFGFFRFFLQV